MFARNSFIWLPVFLVASLLLLNIFFTYHNQRIITYNHSLQTQAERIRSNVSEVLWGTIHGIDIGLRGYAIIPENRFSRPMYLALADKDSLFRQIEADLKKQNFDMAEFYIFRDSLNAYVDLTLQMKDKLDSGDMAGFTKLFEPDKGEALFFQYDAFRQRIESFEQEIIAEANQRYHDALNRQYMVQLALLLVCVPTLLLTVYYFRKSMRVSEQLLQANSAKANMIRKQNEMLEKKVIERTQALRMQMSVTQAQHAELQQINESKDKIFSALSHDLRGPLANLESTLGILREGILTGEETSYILDKLEKSFGKTNNLLHELLVWSKSQMSGLSIDKKPFDLAEALQAMVDLFTENAQEKNIYIQNTAVAGLPVVAGKEMIDLVLRNLLSNAIKFTPEGGTIRIEAYKEKGSACVKITDNGIGMSEDVVYRIVGKAGVAVSTPGTNLEKGTGMGLMLVKEFIRLHQGTFNVDSSPGKGTTFFFSIPLR